MRTCLFVLVLCFTWGRLAWAEDDRAAAMFQWFEQRQYFEPDPLLVAHVSSGPEWEEDGHSEKFDTLLIQARVVSQLGPMAFPECFRRLDDPRPRIRIIAAECLKRITGKSPLWHSFGDPKKSFNGDPNWAARAKNEWSEAYRAMRAGASAFPPAK